MSPTKQLSDVLPSNTTDKELAKRQDAKRNPRARSRKPAPKKSKQKESEHRTKCQRNRAGENEVTSRGFFNRWRVIVFVEKGHGV
jgi:hypothetical protein